MKIKSTISIAIVCVLLVTVLSAVMVYAPPPPDIPSTPFQEVIIANTDPIPVDVTTATLDVTLDDTIAVTNPADESLDVTVTNTDLEPVPVTIADGVNTFEHFQYNDDFDIAIGVAGTSDGIIIPEDKILVVEFIALHAYTPAGGTPPDDIRAHVIDYYPEHSQSTPWNLIFLGTFETDSGGARFITKEVKFLAGPNTPLEIWVTRTPADYRLTVRYSITGYLINAS